MAAQYGTDDDDEEEDYNITNSSSQPAAATVSGKSVESFTPDAEAWKLEVEWALPHLKIASNSGSILVKVVLLFANLIVHNLKGDVRDWRSRLELLSTYSTRVSGTIHTSHEMLTKVSGVLERQMERISAREKYLNTQLNPLLIQFSKKQEQLKQVEAKYRLASGLF